MEIVGMETMAGPPQDEVRGRGQHREEVPRSSRARLSATGETLGWEGIGGRVGGAGQEDLSRRPQGLFTSGSATGRGP